MIYFDFSIRNPWAKDADSVDYFVKEERLTENKSYCLQCSRMSPYNILKINIDLAWRGSDHAGLEFIFEIFGYALMLNIYDNRHWNYDTGRWQTDEEREVALSERY